MIIIRLLLLYFTLSCFVSGSDLLSIGFWNVENLFDLENDPSKRDDEFAIGGKKNVTSDIYELKIKRSVEVLTDLNVDILGLCEVENISVLSDLNNSYKDRDYKIIHFDSPDERGIDNALLYDQNKFSILASKPIENKLGGNDKTRDILYVKGAFLDVTLHIFVNHWPSNYGGKERAIPKRKATAELLMKQIKTIQKNDKLAEIVLIGDFNEDPIDDNVKILEKLGFINQMSPMMGVRNKGTYVYRGKDYFYDQIIISEGLNTNQGLHFLKDSVFILDKPKYRQQDGKYKHYPFRFWAGNKLLGGYSDHLATRIVLRKKK
ncbi:MAG: endonuclease/exonuclease/phosphatase family protein [Candidatus Neomarinimicrobiota bacterium]